MSRTVFLSALQFLDDVVNLAAHLRVEAGGGLVEKHYLRIVHQRHGESQALFLSAGKLAVESVAFFLELEAFEESSVFGVVAVEFREKVDRFLDANFIGQGSGLQNRADLSLELGAALFRVQAADAREPRSGVRMPSRISTVVVFPAPFGPSRPNTSPSSTSKLRPRTASTATPLDRSFCNRPSTCDDGFRHE